MTRAQFFAALLLLVVIGVLVCVRVIHDELTVIAAQSHIQEPQ